MVQAVVLEKQHASQTAPLHQQLPVVLEKQHASQTAPLHQQLPVVQAVDLGEATRLSDRSLASAAACGPGCGSGEATRLSDREPR